MRTSTTPHDESAAPAAPLTEQLLGLLNALALGCAHPRIMTGRSPQGFAETSLVMPSVQQAFLPAGLLPLLEEPWELRLTAATCSGDHPPRHPEEFSVVIVNVPIAMKFGAETGWRYAPDQTARERAHAALDRVTALVPPSFVIDGIRELIVLWTLAEPLNLRRDTPRALALAAALADRMGTSAMDLTATFPVPGGIVREAWQPHPAAAFVLTAPERRYRVEELEKALAAPKGGRR